ncbi:MULTISPECIES: hypothetical protein [Streptomyces]|uniref:ANTAR domain-containing protein n=2 Tax=Streptomyces TaxID=1883 RepID=A0A100YA73_9ACTN|nr:MULTISPECIES: hypothetical protein [Streptomyces]KUH40549.1 hypothetical protein ATE80_01275 [Streptomyces kanasensis]UUS33678.1 hypothetical protein NRO40_24540 [Streptomyces changanensis]
MTVDAVRHDDGSPAHEERLRADADVLAGAARRLLAQAAALEGRPGVPDWCVPTLRRQAECCGVAARDVRDAAALLGRHATRAGNDRAAAAATAAAATTRPAPRPSTA